MSRVWKNLSAAKTAFLIALILFLIGLFLYRPVEKYFLNKSRTDVTAFLSASSTALSYTVNNQFDLLDGLASFALDNNDSERLEKHFREFSTYLVGLNVGYRAVQYFRPGKPVIVFPEKGNLLTLGRRLEDLINDERPQVRVDVARAIESRHLAISGPYELRQGGLGLVGRHPVFRGEELLGIVVIVLDLPPLFAEAGITKLADHIDIALTNQDIRFFGPGYILDNDPVKFTISLPDGEWTLSGIPSGGWEQQINWSMLVVKIAWLIIAVCLVLFAYFIRNRHLELEKLVSSRTRELEISEANYANLYNNAPDMFLSVDAKTSCIVRCNDTLLKTLGYSEKEVIGRSVLDFYSETSREKAKKAFKLFSTKGTVPEMEMQVKSKDGQAHDISLKVSAVRDENGNITRSSSVWRDISGRKQAEEKLREYSENLEKLVQDRTADLEEAQDKLIRKEKLANLGQLAGMLGHELRNPLGVISNAVFYLKTVISGNDKTVDEYVDLIAGEVKNSTKIITDLLSFGKVQSTDKKPVDAIQLINEVLTQYIEGVNIRKETSFDSQVPPLLADPEQLKQVLANLVSNACQAMPDGGELSVKTAMGKKKAIITVSDTGKGISASNLEKVFEPLFTTRRRGIGLGLAITKILVMVNDGKISVTSKEGVGTEFTLEIPVVDS